MVKATLTTFEDDIDQRTFPNMDDLTDHLKENHGKYKSIDAHVVHSAKDIRQGRVDSWKPRK